MPTPSRGTAVTTFSPHSYCSLMEEGRDGERGEDS